MPNQAVFRIGKKYVRGDRKGKRYTETIKLNGSTSIHNFLWDLTDAFDANRCNYIVEWYLEKK